MAYDPQRLRASNIKEQEIILRGVYEAYADFVGENPFQTMDMPIKSDLFDERINILFK